jgi:multidrug efflux pump subunit AcrA (membrane-fusion protein)
MRGSGCLAVGVFTFLTACGGSAPPAQSTATSAPAPAASVSDASGVVRPITQGQLKCAHYASGDGVIGLVLDRTGDHAKVQVDGDKDIVELTMEEDRHFGERRGWYHKRPTS